MFFELNGPNRKTKNKRILYFRKEAPNSTQHYHYFGQGEGGNSDILNGNQHLLLLILDPVQILFNGMLHRAGLHPLSKSTDEKTRRCFIDHGTSKNLQKPGRPKYYVEQVLNMIFHEMERDILKSLKISFL